MGYLASGMTNSLESVVMADELINWVSRYGSCRVWRISEETLALDLIHESGPANAFIGHENAPGRITATIGIRSWSNSRQLGELVGRRRRELCVPVRVHTNRALKLSATHQVEQLPTGIVEAIQEVVDRAAEHYL